MTNNTEQDQTATAAAATATDAATTSADATATDAATARAQAALGDALNCPVCLNVFSSRIRQCKFGHSVCANCHVRLQDCPTCRSDFAPEIRNYALEEVIGRLQQTGLAAASEEPDVPPAALPADQRAATDYAEVPASVVQRVHGLINDVNGLIRERRSAAATGTTTNSGGSDNNSAQPPQPNASRHNHQPPGLFTCRADVACRKRLPACRLLNHVRQQHADTFMHSTSDLLGRRLGMDVVPAPRDVRLELAVSLQHSIRRAIHVRGSGVFFLCFDAGVPATAAGQRSAGGRRTARSARPATAPASTQPAAAAPAADAPTHFAWVQAATRNEEARRYQFRCQLSFVDGAAHTHTTATYADTVFGDSWTAEQVRTGRYCMSVHVPRRLVRAKLSVVLRRAPAGGRDGGGMRVAVAALVPPPAQRRLVDTAVVVGLRERAVGAPSQRGRGRVPAAARGGVVVGGGNVTNHGDDDDDDGGADEILAAQHLAEIGMFNEQLEVLMANVLSRR